MRFFVLSGVVGLFALSACDVIQKPTAEVPPAVISETSDVVTVANEDTVRPIVRPEDSPKIVPVESSQRSPELGETIASLGLLDRDGLWLRTPLVSTQSQGRVKVKTTGATVDLVLLPLEGKDGAGSQISIAAMQALGVSITDLVPLTVTRL